MTYRDASRMVWLCTFVTWIVLVPICAVFSVKIGIALVGAYTTGVIWMAVWITIPASRHDCGRIPLALIEYIMATLFLWWFFTALNASGRHQADETVG